MITNSITHQVDKILVVPILGFAILGNYSLALQVITLLSATSGIIHKFLLPHAVDGDISKNLRRNTIFLSFGFVFLGVIIFPMIIPVFFPDYVEVIDIIQIMSFSVVPITIYLFYYTKFLALENGKTPLHAGIISSSVMITGMIVLGSLFGAKGIAITHVIAYSSACIFAFIMDRKFKNSG